ncbi:LacI family DNA-binding transcriptional regulator [Kocuria sp. CH-021]|uniref:LacI family DNA-binding transcriptional regulator n=1 Tax=Kocuria sp. CH-021 TaxID=3406735 RepID=UPI003C7599B7
MGENAVVNSRPPRPPTIYDVARAAGVSKSLVSLVLRGSPSVSEARRTAVLEAVEQLGYRPSQAAAALAGAATRTIGVVLDDFRNLWFVSLLQGLQDGLAPHGFRIAVSDHTLNAHVETGPLDGFLAMRVDGLVIATEPTPAMRVPEGLPVVVAGSRRGVIPGADVVADDDRLGGRLATEHLLELGHRRLGHLTGDGGAAELRARGFRDALRERGLRAPVVRGAGGTTEEDGYRAALRLLAEAPATTAVFAANDTMAMGALAAARESGLRVPEDLSVIGYDDSPVAATHLLRLTTVDGRNAEVGAAAAERLVQRATTTAAAPVRTALLTPRLVLRSSCAAPRSG